MLYKADPSSHYLDDPSGCLQVWGCEDSKVKEERVSVLLTVRPWRLFPIPHTLFSSCFSQAATDWAPNKEGRHKSLTAVSCWPPRWAFRTVFISNQQNKISVNEVTAPSWPWEALGCVWVSVDRLSEHTPTQEPSPEQWAISSFQKPWNRAGSSFCGISWKLSASNNMQVTSQTECHKTKLAAQTPNCQSTQRAKWCPLFLLHKLLAKYFFLAC